MKPEIARVGVVGVDGQPLSPTTPARARKMIRDKVALPKRNRLGIFYIQMTRPVGSVIPHETVAGDDPGKRYGGIAVQTPKATLWLGHLNLPFQQVKEAMTSRAQLRRGRRFRKCPRRECRFANRTGNRIPPSIKANRELEYRVLIELRKIFPITKAVYEVVKATGSKSFSPVMVGQQWMTKKLSAILPTETREGWETSRLRQGYLGLEKEKKQKGLPIPATHAVDGVALAASAFVRYAPRILLEGSGYTWKGSCQVTPAPFSVISRPTLFRRKLHVENPAKGGVRKRHGGTTTPYGFRKGDFVEGEKAGQKIRGYVSGYSEVNKVVSIADSNWRRIGQYSVSKVRLLHRSTRLLVEHTPCAKLR